MSGIVVGMVTCGSRKEARAIAQTLLKRRCVACVNILAGVESQYWWQDKLESGKEWLLLIKTTRAKTKETIKVIKSVHSYDVPEIIFLPVQAGESRYLGWVRQSVRALALAAAFVFATGAAHADKIDDMRKQLGAAEEEQRAEAGDELIKIGGERVLGIFRDLVESSNPERRMMGAAGLMQLSDADEDVKRVRERLKDESSIVRWSAAIALGRSSRSEAIDWLDAVAKNDEAESVREAAVDGAARLRARIYWLRSFREALQEARKQNKMVLAYFTAHRSDVCDRFENGVLATESVVTASRDFVCWRENVIGGNGEAGRLDVRGAPSLLILDAQGNEVSRVSGLVESKKLLAAIAEARQGSMTMREARRRAARDPSDVTANWKVAKQYLEDDRADLAEPHLKNVIQFDEPNQMGFTDDAIFALGFSYGQQRSYQKAVYCMEQLLKRWPAFEDRDKALYCLGLSHLAIGHKAEARAALQKLVTEHGTESLAKAAKPILDRLNAETTAP